MNPLQFFKTSALTLAVITGSPQFTHAQSAWQQGSGTATKDVRSLSSNGTTLFAGTNAAGVYRSTDGGVTWTPSSTGLTSLVVLGLGSNGNTMYAGCGGSGGGVFKSTDNGSTWTGINNGLTSVQVYALVVKGNVLLAGTQDAGVFFSNNGGNSWAKKNTGLTNTDVRYIALQEKNWYAATAGGVFLSSDSGSTWMAVNSGLTALNVNTVTVMGSKVFAGTNGGGVFVSSDNGTSWKAMNTGLASTQVNSFAVAGNTILAGTYGQGIYMSTNYGNTWQPVNTGLPTTHPNISFWINGTNILAGTQGDGVWTNTLLSTIGGTAKVKAGSINNGYVKLYQYAKGSQMMQKDSVAISAGSYSFSNVMAADYVVKVFPDAAGYPLALSTYGDSTVYWDTAKVITATLGLNVTENVQVKELPVLTGKCLIRGKITKAAGYKKTGDPVPDVDVSIGKKPGGIIVSHAKTDSAGVYEFEDMEIGSYSIYADIPGLPMVSTYNITVGASDTLFKNKDFKADSAKISIDTISSTIGITEAHKGLSQHITIWPIPATDQISIYIPALLSQKACKAIIFDITGRQIQQVSILGPSCQLSVSGLPGGVYILEVMTQGDFVIRKRFVKA